MDGDDGVSRRTGHTEINIITQSADVYLSTMSIIRHALTSVSAAFIPMREPVCSVRHVLCDQKHQEVMVWGERLACLDGECDKVRAGDDLRKRFSLAAAKRNKAKIYCGMNRIRSSCCWSGEDLSKTLAWSRNYSRNSGWDGSG